MSKFHCLHLQVRQILQRGEKTFANFNSCKFNDFTLKVIVRPGSHELRHSNYCSNSKSYYEIFSTTTLDYWKNYHDSFGVTHAQYELRGLLWFRLGGADSIENDDDIGLSEHLS